MSTIPPSSAERIERWEVLDLLTALVQKSLVVYEEDEQGQGRYRLLEPMRQYARDRLVEVGEGEAARERHFDWWLALAKEAEPKIRFGADQAAWLDRLERENDNLRAALEWCEATEEGREAGLRLASAVTEFWWRRGYVAEGWQTTTHLLEAASRTSAVVRGEALAAASLLAYFRSDLPAQAALAAEALALGREAGDPRLTAIALNRSGYAAYLGGDLDRAAALLEEGLSLARQLEDQRLAAGLHHILALVRMPYCDWEGQRALHQEMLNRFRELEDASGIAVQHANLGWVARAEGNNKQAEALWREALSLWQEAGERSPNFLEILHALADLALDQGDPDAAKAYYEEALALAREMNDKPKVARALIGVARVAQAEGNPQTAWMLLEEAEAMDVCVVCGHLLLELGNYSAGRSRYEAGLALRREREDTGGVAWVLLEAGHAAWLEGEPDITQSHAIEALALFRGRNDRLGILAALENLAAAALAQGNCVRAARLLGAAEAQREALKGSGPHLWPLRWRRPQARIGDAVCAASLRQEFAAAWAAGRAMSLEDAIQFALGASDA